MLNSKEGLVDGPDLLQASRNPNSAYPSRSSMTYQPFGAVVTVRLATAFRLLTSAVSTGA
jgi:hypothetical protein